MNAAELPEVVYQFIPGSCGPRALGTTTRPSTVAWWPRYRYHDLSLHILGGSIDAAYTAQLGVRGEEQEDAEHVRRLGWRLRFGCSVSLLGPYYVVRHTGRSGEEPHEVAREIEATYPGYWPIPPEIGDVVVRDVALDTRGFGKVTIANCLLATHWAAEEGAGPAGVSSGK